MDLPGGFGVWTRGAVKCGSGRGGARSGYRWLAG